MKNVNESQAIVNAIANAKSVIKLCSDDITDARLKYEEVKTRMEDVIEDRKQELKKLGQKLKKIVGI